MDKNQQYETKANTGPDNKTRGKQRLQGIQTESLKAQTTVVLYNLWIMAVLIDDSFWNILKSYNNLCATMEALFNSLKELSIGLNFVLLFFIALQFL